MFFIVRKIMPSGCGLTTGCSAVVAGELLLLKTI